MIFGKHINKYYLKYSWILIIGILALVAVDYFQLKIPEIYSTIVDGFDPNVTDVVINKTDLSNLCLTIFASMPFELLLTSPSYGITK